MSGSKLKSEFIKIGTIYDFYWLNIRYSNFSFYRFFFDFVKLGKLFLFFLATFVREIRWHIGHRH